MARRRCNLLAALPFASGYHQTPDGLFATTQVAVLDNGHIRLPSSANVTRLAVEIGCSDLHTLDEEMLPFDPETFLISFEPVLDKYAVLLARAAQRFYSNVRNLANTSGEVQRKQNFFSPLGMHHPRGVVLPFAVSEDGGPATFHVARVAGCSSLLPINAGSKYYEFCKDVAEDRTIDTLSVAQAMALLPPQLPIRLLKVDTQGLDSRLVSRLPVEILRRVHTIQFETALSGETCGGSLYLGTKPCASAEAYLKSHGFIGSCPVSKRSHKCEANAVFRNPRYGNVMA